MKDNYFFDNASTSFPKPEVVYRFMDSFARSTAVNPGRSGYTLSVESEQMVLQTRRMLASFFNYNGDPARIVFTQNITDSLNLALQSILRDGGHVVTTSMEHNSVLRPLTHMAKTGLELTHVEADADGYINVDTLTSACRHNTRLIVVNHGSNVTGAVQPLQEISAVCRNKGIPLLLDTAQTAGVVPIDLDKTPVDLLAFTGHKGLFGPMGIGGLVVANSDLQLNPARVGGTGVDSKDPLHPQIYPYRLEAGTLAVPAIAGLHAAQQWFALLGKELNKHPSNMVDNHAFDIAGFNPAIELDTAAPAKNHQTACATAQLAIGRHEITHIDRIVNALVAHPAIRILGQRQVGLSRVATMSIVMKHMPATMLADRLDDEHHICVRAGLHCAPMAHQQLGTDESEGALRISPGVFTTDDDVEHLINALLVLADS